MLDLEYWTANLQSVLEMFCEHNFSLIQKSVYTWDRCSAAVHMCHTVVIGTLLDEMFINVIRFSMSSVKFVCWRVEMWESTDSLANEHNTKTPLKS